MNDVDNKILLNAADLVKLTGLSRPVVYQLLHKKDFPTVKIGRRMLASRTAVEEYFERQAQGGD